MYIVAILLLLVGVIALIASRRTYRAAPTYSQRSAGEPGSVIQGARLILVWIGAAAVLLGLLAGASTVFYVQDVGEAKVQTDVSGKIVGQTTDAGFHTKLPWATTHTFNIRNQTADFVNSAKDNDVEDRTGPYITVNDRDGVSSNISLNLQYSIDADSVGDIYTRYKNEETFKKDFVANSVRNIVRQAPNDFDTIDLITKRGEVEKKVIDLLEDKWEGSGVHLDNLALQEIALPDAVKQSYSQAQQAQIEVEKEKANLEAQKVKAQQQVQSAKAQADANDLLNKHPLSDAALKQAQIDALKTAGENGSLIVVPSDGNNILNLPTPDKK